MADLGHAHRICVVGQAPSQYSSYHGGQSREPGLYVLAVQSFEIQQWKYPRQIPSRRRCAKEKRVKATRRTPNTTDGA